MSHKMNILLIDDDEKTLELLKKDLNELGLAENIYTANNGIEAINKYAQSKKDNQQVQLIFSDIVMPISDGIQFLESFREKYDPDHLIPIIMLTSKSDKSLVLKSISFGVHHYLLKPWSQQSVMQKVIDVINSKEAKE